MAKGETLFPELRAAMQRNPDASGRLKPMTFYRYVAGELPKQLDWFIDHPEMLEALARDARNLTAADRKKRKKAVMERAQAQKAYREKRSGVSPAESEDDE